MQSNYDDKLDLNKRQSHGGQYNASPPLNGKNIGSIMRTNESETKTITGMKRWEACSIFSYG